MSATVNMVSKARRTSTPPTYRRAGRIAKERGWGMFAKGFLGMVGIFEAVQWLVEGHSLIALYTRLML